MLDRWWSTLRRMRDERTLRKRPIPDALWELTLARYPFLAQRSTQDRAVLRELSTLFLAQKELNEDDRAFIASGEVAVDFLGDEMHDFRDGAGIVANVDLVVSIDTSLTHLAGAMGKPVWAVLADVPDWRWMLDREDSPWYPTMRLVRQQMPARWSDPIARIARELSSLAG